MKNVLVAYGSKMGGTAGIAQKIAETLRDRGFEATLTPASKVPRRAAFDAAVVGSGLYAGRWRGEAIRLLRRLVARSRGLPVWLFHSGPLGDEDADQPQQVPKRVAAYAAALDAPDVITFGGRLADNAPGFIARAMVRNGLSGDWRDMDQVAAWANHIADRLK